MLILSLLTIIEYEDKRLQNCIVLKTEDLVTEPEDGRIEFITRKGRLDSEKTGETGVHWNEVDHTSKFPIPFYHMCPNLKSL